MLALAAAGLFSCVAPPRVASAEECVFSDDCQTGLICAGQKCRAVCRDDRDCSSGWRCRSSAEPTKRVCLPPEELGYCRFSSDCGPPLLCSAGRCIVQARTPEDCVNYDPNLVAVPSGSGFECRWRDDLADAGTD
ncbi:MAG: hypothetical protein JNK05_31975 [Myxococcales bacterium]|nr:hypothetical protein [Myxococcales bacterium]